jgi:hypothetical protein
MTIRFSPLTASDNFDFTLLARAKQEQNMPQVTDLSYRPFESKTKDLGFNL